MQAHEFRMPRSTKPPLPARRPLVTVDIAALTIIDGRPHVLLARRPDAPGEPWPGAWALPGGSADVDADASLEACPRRVLRARTAIGAQWLQPVAAHRGRHRDPPDWTITPLHAAGRWAGRSRALASAAPERPAEGREARVRPRPAGGRSGRSHPPQERVHRPSGAPSSRPLHPARDAERLRDRARPLDRQEGLP